MKLGLQDSADDQAWRTRIVSSRDLARSVPPRDLSFRSAHRHSRRVRFLRTALPVSIGVVVIAYALFGWLNPFGALPGTASIAKMVISGTRVTMDLPRLAGYTRDGRQYELTATAATQDLKRPALIELKDIRAKVEMRNGNTVNVRATSGLYDTKAETIVMREDVFVSTTTGTEARLKEATMDIRKGHVLSEQPVEVLLANGRVNARGMEVRESGAVLNFTGGVSVEMNSGIPLAATERAQ